MSASAPTSAPSPSASPPPPFSADHDHASYDADAVSRFLRVMYGIHMGAATPPPEPGAERVIVRIRPQEVYMSPYGRTAAE
jgi:hypothetical protein